MFQYIDALRLTYEAQIATAKANLSVYMDNSVGVAEHPNIIKSIDSLISDLAQAQEKLDAVNSLEEYYE
tara:strand:+ start:7772 stop:7978 length:207 start_codon:yes stop_codon:yes gene_type:complete